MTPAETLNTLLAGAAIVISILSLVWNIRRASWDRPRVVVTGRAGVGLSGDRPNEPYWELSLSVANTGERAVTLERGSWLVDNGAGGIHWMVPDDVFPVRLEPHDSRDWTIKHPLRGSTLERFRGRPAVCIVQRPTWLERRKGVGATRWVYGPVDSTVRPSGDVTKLPKMTTRDEADH
jgi:hypothetical protein